MSLEEETKSVKSQVSISIPLHIHTETTKTRRSTPATRPSSRGGPVSFSCKRGRGNQSLYKTYEIHLFYY
jgi:hypothetical protein